MLTDAQVDELMEFLGRYCAALSQMAEGEKEKLHALTSNSLPRVEHAISLAQANSMQIENLEKQRIALMTGFGCGNYNHRELLGAVQPERREALLGVIRQFEEHIETVRFYNSRSMDVARDNLMRVSPETVLAQRNGKASDPYTAAKKGLGGESTSLLQTKI